MAATAEPAPAARLDAFAFPSDTTFRFVLLVVAVVGASLYVYTSLYFAWGSDARAFVAAYERCIGSSEILDSEVASFAEPGRRAQAFQDCIGPTTRRQLPWILGGTAALAAGAAAIYWFLPAWKRRRRRLVPLAAEDAPEVTATLEALVREAGLSEPPEFLWDPLEPAATGLAFGRRGRYAVAVTGGLVILHTRDPDAFRAVVRHELAHLRNGDVDTTYGTIAVWWAFVAVALGPFAVSLVSTDADYLLALAWRTAALALLVFLVRNAVLRARELYADVRAHEWDGPGGALGRTLEGLPAERRGWRRLLRVHPDPAARRRALDDPRPLFRMGFWDAFGAGLAATLADANVVGLLSSFSLGGLELRWLAALVFAPLAVGVVGLGAWRATYAALARGERPPSGLALGLGLGAGFLAGQQLSFTEALGLSTSSGTGVYAFGLVWALVLLASTVLFARWLVAGAEAWLRAADGHRPPRLVVAAVLAVASGVLALWLGWLFLVRELQPVVGLLADAERALHDAVATAVWAGPESLWLAVQHPLALYFAVDRFTLPLVIALWALPLGAWLWSRARGRGSSGLRPAYALAAGLAAGVAFTLLLLALRLAIHYSVSVETRDTDAFPLAFFFWNLSLALVLQVAVAAFVATRVERLAAVHGLFAAFAGACVMAGALVGAVSFGTCVEVFSVGVDTSLPCKWSTDSSFLSLTFRQLIGEGALFAVPAVAAVALARAGRRAATSGRRA